MYPHSVRKESCIQKLLSEALHTAFTKTSYELPLFKLVREMDGV